MIRFNQEHGSTLRYVILSQRITIKLHTEGLEPFSFTNLFSNFWFLAIYFLGENSPCQNNGTCIEDDSNFSCECLPGFTGQFCEQSKIFSQLWVKKKESKNFWKTYLFNVAFNHNLTFQILNCFQNLISSSFNTILGSFQSNLKQKQKVINMLCIYLMKKIPNSVNKFFQRYF